MVCLARGVLVDHRCTCAVVTNPGLQVGEAGPRLCRRLWDNEVLMGWYAANDGSIRSKGTMYFVLHPHGEDRLVPAPVVRAKLVYGLRGGQVHRMHPGASNA
jgi:hypothetical protein